MSTYGILLIDLIALAMLVLLLNLVRTKKLHVGYAVIWCLALIILMLFVSIPPLLDLLPGAVGAIYPASALSLLAFVFIFLVLIFFSVQLSLISSRQIDIIQKLAMEELLEEEKEDNWEAEKGKNGDPDQINSG